MGSIGGQGLPSKLLKEPCPPLKIIERGHALPSRIIERAMPSSLFTSASSIGSRTNLK